MTTSATTNSLCDRAAPWLQFPASFYLDRRQRGWSSAEKRGDVRFVAATRVVLVNRARAQHIAAALGINRQAAALESLLALPARMSPLVSRPALASPPTQQPTTNAGRWRRVLTGSASLLALRCSSRRCSCLLMTAPCSSRWLSAFGARDFSAHAAERSTMQEPGAHSRRGALMTLAGEIARVIRQRYPHAVRFGCLPARSLGPQSLRSGTPRRR